MTQDQLARYQQAFAKIGEAVNQCVGCGVFRLDGNRPILHHADCPDQPDPAELAEMIKRDLDLIRLRRLYGLDLT
jgi:hypothetical protein